MAAVVEVVGVVAAAAGAAAVAEDVPELDRLRVEDGRRVAGVGAAETTASVTATDAAPLAARTRPTSAVGAAGNALAGAAAAVVVVVVVVDALELE